MLKESNQMKLHVKIMLNKFQTTNFKKTNYSLIIKLGWLAKNSKINFSHKFGTYLAKKDFLIVNFFKEQFPKFALLT